MEPEAGQYFEKRNVHLSLHHLLCKGDFGQYLPKCREQLKALVKKA